MTGKDLIGLLLSPKDMDHLGITQDVLQREYSDMKLVIVDNQKPISEQGSFTILVHKASDYIKGFRNCDQTCRSVLLEILGKPEINRMCLDDPMTVIDLANRSLMSSMMDKCQFKMNGISIVVPTWVTVYSAADLPRVKQMNLTYPLICKALCGGEGEGSHAMQLIFNQNQLDALEIIPCIAQQFMNHGGEIVKIFVYGKKHVICTRPSVRNFPINGHLIGQCDSILFDSQQVSKMSSRTFLNNYQTGFVFRSSAKNDHIIDEEVAAKLIETIRSKINCTFIGIDLFITNDGKQYNLFDVNYLPSFETVENRFDLFLDVINDLKSRKVSPNLAKDRSE